MGRSSTREQHETQNDPDTALERALLHEIRLKGHLDARWTDWFGGLTITLEENGETLLTGPVIDQAALHGLLKKVRDLGMPLLSVNCAKPGRRPDAVVSMKLIQDRSRR